MKQYLGIFAALWLIAVQAGNAQSAGDVLADGFQWRNIGPANQGGRIVDIEALEGDFAHLWMATGSGGVWRSENAGTSWTPIFEEYETASIGDIAVFQKNPRVIWVGTGEANNRNSVSWGNGMYKSTDGGESFVNVGLESTHHIARVVTHPDDPGEVCVCATGHLWGYSGDRGLFQTTDGGQSWQKLTNGLPDDGKTGCTDLVRDPRNPRILYAAFYHRRRQPWHFHSGGEAGGIFKSSDGGKSWKKLTEGLPAGPTGRIGLAIFRNNPKILMALVEAEETDDLSRPGSGVYRTENGGKTWKYVNTYNNRPFYYSQIRINPHDDRKVYLLTTSFMVSEDGGTTFVNGSEDQEVHGDFHAMWLDPDKEERYYLGADKGLSITHDHGAHFTLLDNLPIGQFYRIGFDMRDPYYVYGGLQDNGMYGVASFSRDARGILNDANWKLHWGDGQYVAVHPDDWRTMYTSMENGSYLKYDPLTYEMSRISPRSNNIVNYDEITGGDGMLDFRFNWSAPMEMSVHDPSVLYTAGNYLFKSTDAGNTWRIISPDLSTDDPMKRKKGESGGITPDNTGAETHCSITNIAESPIDPGLIWIGTDDGNIQLSRNGGMTWENVRSRIPDVPEGLWVSRVEASHFDPAEAYITFDGHRSDHFEPWIFKTEDYGQSWKSLRGNLPGNEVVRVIRQDLKNHNLLFIGTETGIYCSLDDGVTWTRFMPGMPTVSVYDLKIHPRDNDLIAGTHGRSIWILDDITPLQQLGSEVMQGPAFLFEQRQSTEWENTSRGGQRGHFWYAGQNPPEIELLSTKPRARYRSNAIISYLINKPGQGPATLEISDRSGRKRRTLELDNSFGLHRVHWDRKFDAAPFTAAELKEIEDIFEEIMQQFSSSGVRRAYRQFKAAKTPMEQREAIEVLTGSYMSFELDDRFTVPKAHPGTYLLKLKYGGGEWLGTLRIREDPLKK